jgi:hypothetical protein
VVSNDYSLEGDTDEPSLDRWLAFLRLGGSVLSDVVWGRSAMVVLMGFSEDRSMERMDKASDRHRILCHWVRHVFVTDTSVGKDTHIKA